MSYISEISPEFLARSSTPGDERGASLSRPAMPASPSDKLAASLEVVIGLAMLSGLSLAFCTIAAGAF